MWNRKQLHAATYIIALVLSMMLIVELNLLPAFAIGNAIEYENQDNGLSGQTSCYGVNWLAQSFYASPVGHTISFVNLSSVSIGSPTGTVTLGLRACASNGAPTGSDLASATVSAASFTNANFTSWSGNVALQSLTLYALVLRFPTGTSSKYVQWKYDASDVEVGNYSSSTDSGSSWTVNNNWDFAFEVWGYSAYPQYSSLGTNQTTVNQAMNFTGYWADVSSGSPLSKGIFGCNITSSQTNDTAVDFTGKDTTWFNITKTPAQATDPVGTVIAWQEWMNSSANIFNSTGWQYATISAPVTFYFDTGGVLAVNESVLTNGTVLTYNTLTPHIDLMGLANSTYTFLNFTWNYGNNLSNPYVFTVANTTTIWAHFTYFNSTINPYVDVAFSWSPGNPIINQVITFTSYSNSSSSITNYQWNFGDGNTTSGAGYSSITHYYTGNQSVSVSLTITSSAGSSSISETIIIGWGANHTEPTWIVASYNWSPGNPSINQLITFTSYSSSSSSITDFSWNFGDGNTTHGAGYSSITHFYPVNETISVSLTVTSSVGTSAITESIVNGWGNNASDFISSRFSWSPNWPNTNQTTTLTSQATSNQALAGYIWNFGDGNSTMTLSSSITHAWTSNNSYPVILSSYAQISYALGFDGSTSYVEAPYISDYNLVTSFTIEAWIYKSNNNNAEEDILRRSDQYALCLGTDTNKISVRAGNKWNNFAWTCPLNAWQHIIVTYDNSSLLYYVNGTLLNTNPVQQILSGNNTVDTSSVLRLGYYWANTWFKGSIDEVRLYNRAINSTEISYSFNLGIGFHTSLNQTGLVLWMHNNWGSGSVAYDDSSLHNNGACTSTSWVSGHVPVLSNSFTEVIVVGGSGGTVSPGGGGSLAWGFIVLIILIPSCIVLFALFLRRR